jgi:D-alanine-D-alanine ligase
MKVGVLIEPELGSSSLLDGHEPPFDPSPFLPEHAFRRFEIHKATSAAQVGDLAHSGCDVFINLCDGTRDEDLPGIDVVLALEAAGLPFTGATSAFYEPTREAMKAACRRVGVAAPASAAVRDDAAIARAAEALRFPLIVKHENSYGSIGMTRDARVTTPDALRREARRMIADFGGALIEEFVEGREFTVLVTENPDDPRRPHAYVPVECRFPEGETFKHFDLKWVSYEGLGWFPVADAALDARLREAATRMFLGMNGTGYGRCDMRLDAAGVIHMLEINPNCAMFYPRAAWGSADIILSLDPAGHRGFLERSLRVAQGRRRAARESAYPTPLAGVAAIVA